jgi:hypothetical protein
VIKTAIIVVLALVLSILTSNHLKVWQNQRTLWADAVQHAPCSARAHWNLSQTLPQGPVRLMYLQAVALLSIGDQPGCRVVR